MKRVVVEKKQLARSDIVFRGEVLANERYSALRHILRYEDDAEIVKAALEIARKHKFERKVNLLEKKYVKLTKKGT